MNRIILLLILVLCVFTGCESSGSEQQNPVVTEPILPIETEMPRESTMPSETEAAFETEEPTEQEILPQESEVPEILFTEVRSAEGISSETLNWYSSRNSENMPPASSQANILSKYKAYYLGNTDEKKIYMTFDMDYEVGYTEKILDILKEKNASASFFVTKKYIMDNEELIKRIVSEGYIVANHSKTSIFLPDLTDEQLVAEVIETADYFKQVTGKNMPRFFRVHSVEYSERILDVVGKLGFETVFWSFAYVDWEVNNQPDINYAYNMMINNLHNGSIMLLHAVSKTNMEVLPDFIDSARELGYSFGSLDDIPPSNID